MLELHESRLSSLLHQEKVITQELRNPRMIGSQVLIKLHVGWK